MWGRQCSVRTWVVRRCLGFSTGGHADCRSCPAPAILVNRRSGDALKPAAPVLLASAVRSAWERGSRANAGSPASGGDSARPARNAVRRKNYRRDHSHGRRSAASRRLTMHHTGRARSDCAGGAGGAMRRGDHHHWQWQRMARAWRLLAVLFAAAPASLLVVGCPVPDCPGPGCLAADCPVAGPRAAARFRRLPAPAWRSAVEIAMPARGDSRPKSTAATAWNQAVWLQMTAGQTVFVNQHCVFA
jgi:hypothetical protein